MEYKIANRIKDVQGSIIRELFKLTNDPNMISFGGGNPSSESFPCKEIADIIAEIMAKDPVSMLQYGLSEGYSPLRETMKAYLSKAEGIDFEENELYILSGGQQVADLTTKILINEGDIIISEDPAFVGCLNTFRSYGAKLLGVPMEPDGMNIEVLEEMLKSNKVRMIYTIPSFQNPTGYTTSLEKRKKIYELACEYDVMILEDNPYGELRFSGETIPTIKSFDTDGRVIYAGSFSKVMAPAFRLGFAIFNKALSPRMSVAKQCTDVHSTVLFQHICNEYMTKYDYQKHIEELRTLYQRKSDLMLKSMEKHFSPAIQFNRPEGGLFVMAFLPEGMDAYPFVKEGISRGVSCVPGVAFAVDQSRPSNGFRLNFSMPSDEQIIRGTEILGKLTYEVL